jgi:hypothetical protein
MAYTLSERYNIRNGITPLDTTVSQINMLSEGIYKVASEVVCNNLTIYTIIPAWPAYTLDSKGVTDAQLLEWSMRALDGRIQNKTFTLIFDDDGFSDAFDDSTYLGVIRRCIWPLASRIGSGTF